MTAIAARRGPESGITPGGMLLALLRVDGDVPPRMAVGTWDRVVALAVREQVAPLVLAAVRGRRGAPAPEAALAALEREAARSAVNAAAAYEQLAAVLGRLRAAGVAAGLIKGAALARFVYADAGLRPFHDLDLLVSPCRREAANRALREAGYATAVAGRGDPDAAGEQVYWDPAWRRAPVDVHWRFDAAPVCLGLDYDEMLRHARPAAIGTERALVLTPADTLVALSAHFTKHLWGSRPRLRYLRDVAEVARRCRVDWARVVQTASEAPRMRSALRLTLSAAARVTGAPVPRDTLDALAPSRGPHLDRRLREWVVRRILHRDSPFAALAQVAAMRWLDGDAPGVYPRLATAVLGVQSRRLAAAVLGGRGRRALRRLPLRLGDTGGV